MESKTLGIDISKAKFDVILLDAERVRHHCFKNSPTGFRALYDWLRQHKALEAHACMEATSVYGLELARFLYGHKVKVSIMNPACIHAFAKSELQRNKTDRIDAGIIARYCRAMEPREWAPPSPEIEQLQALVRRLEDLKALRTQELNRLEVTGQPQAVQASQAALLQLLNEQIEEIKEAIAEHCDGHPGLKSQLERLQSIPGVGLVTAALLLSELVEVSRYANARQLAAYAGLVPSEHTSGSSVRGKARLSKRGNARLRSGLFLPALVAMRWNPLLATFAQRLLAKGKAKKIVIIAVMRKLIHIAFGVLKTGKPFDPKYTSKTAQRC